MRNLKKENCTVRDSYAKFDINSKKEETNEKRLEDDILLFIESNTKNREIFKES